MNEPAATLSVVTLFLNADIVVQTVLVLLLLASIWSWAVIIEKLSRLAAARRSAVTWEAHAGAARSAQELVADGRAVGADHPAGVVLAAGVEECELPIRSRARAWRSGATASSARCASRSAANCAASKRACHFSRPWARRRRSSGCSARCGDHAQLRGHRRGTEHQSRGRRAGYRRSIVRHRDGPCRGDPGGRRLQQVHRRDRPHRRPHAEPDRARRGLLSRLAAAH